MDSESDLDSDGEDSDLDLDSDSEDSDLDSEGEDSDSDREDSTTSLIIIMHTYCCLLHHIKYNELQ